MVRALVKNMTIKHDGKDYGPGSVIELDEATAQELSRFLAPASTKGSAESAADEAAQEQEPQSKLKEQGNGTRRKS